MSALPPSLAIGKWRECRPTSKHYGIGIAQTIRQAVAIMDEQPDEEITDRLILPMLNACVGCFREGVIDDLDILDGAMIFATGFAPFRGVPMHYARRRGMDDMGQWLGVEQAQQNYIPANYTHALSYIRRPDPR